MPSHFPRCVAQHPKSTHNWRLYPLYHTPPFICFRICQSFIVTVSLSHPLAQTVGNDVLYLSHTHPLPYRSHPQKHILTEVSVAMGFGKGREICLGYSNFIMRCGIVVMYWKIILKNTIFGYASAGYSKSFNSRTFAIDFSVLFKIGRICLLIDKVPTCNIDNRMSF